MILRTVSAIIFCKLLLDQFLAMGNSTDRTLFAFITSVALVNLAYESREMGCSLGDCKAETNRNARKDAPTDGDARMCEEGKRVTWRRAYLLAYVILILLNLAFPASSPQKNMSLMMSIFVLLHFYFNFEAFHRFTIWCKQ